MTQEMIIQGSVFGAMSDPNQWGQFSCIKEDGTLDEEKFEGYMRVFANDGANSTREIPFLVTDDNYTGTAKQRNFLPAVWREDNETYDWDQLNQTYFDNLKKMIKIANRYNMSFEFSIFDRCHSLNMQDSPWNLNCQGISGYYDWNENVYAQNYVKKIIDTVKDAKREFEEESDKELRVLFELENEPMDEDFTNSAVGTLNLLLDNGFEKDQVEDGVFYLPYENGKPSVQYDDDDETLIRNDLFEALKKAKEDAGLYSGEDGEDKSRYFSTIHSFLANPDVLDMLEDALGHTRRFSLSTDGQKPKPTEKELKEKLGPLFEEAEGHSNRRNHLETWKFENLYRGDLEGKSDLGDDMHGVRGISEAYHDVFGEYPENYDKYPG